MEEKQEEAERGRRRAGQGRRNVGEGEEHVETQQRKSGGEKS